LNRSVSAIRVSRIVNQSPVFYGWIILLAGTLGMIMTSPGQTYSVSIFTDYFIQDLGINRSVVSSLYTIGTLVGSFAQPLVGRQIDRRGPRQVVVFVSLFFGLGCILMGFVNNALMLGLGFLAIRMFGQGNLGLVSRNVINQWWVRRRGVMMGLSGVIVSLLGLGAFPSLITWLISLYGWRSTYIILGFMVLLIMTPLGLIFFRDRPEDYGLQPDGDERPDSTSRASQVQPAEENWTLAEAMRTPIFWVFLTGMASISMLATGLFFHMVSIFEDNGLESNVAASVFVPIAVTTAAVSLVSGALVGRIRMRVILALALFFQALALMMAQFLGSVELAFVYGVVLGVILGLAGTVGSVAWAMYFGRQHLGSISGFTVTVGVIGTALGPLPFGVARDLMGSYDLALTVTLVLPLLLGVLTLFVPKP